MGVINGRDIGNTLDIFATLAKNVTNSTRPLPATAGAVDDVLAIEGESERNLDFDNILHECTDDT